MKMAMAAFSLGTARKAMQAFKPTGEGGININLLLRCQRTGLPIISQVHNIVGVPNTVGNLTWLAHRLFMMRANQKTNPKKIVTADAKNIQSRSHPMVR